MQGAGHTVLFHPDKIELRRSESESEQNEIVIRFEGANKDPEVLGEVKLPGVAHFTKIPDLKTGVPASLHTLP